MTCVARTMCHHPDPFMILLTAFDELPTMTVTMLHSMKMVQRELDICPCGHERWGHDPSKIHRKSGYELSVGGSTESQEAL